MAKIKIVGLGPGDEGQIGVEALELMKNAENLVLRTKIHPSVKYLEEQKINFTTCDDLYNQEESFDSLYEKISRRLIDICETKEEIVYAVPGHPLVAEKSVQLILERAGKGIDIEILPAMSFIDAILSSLRIDPINGLKILDGLSLDEQKPDPKCGNIITQVYDSYVASEVKLKLMDIYEDETEITVIQAAGVKNLERIEKLPIYELDRIHWVDYLTSIYIPPISGPMKVKTMDDLVHITEILRSEKGCDWDKKQTTESLQPYLIEETYEVLDAIEKGDVKALVEELGDLLFQIIIHAQIGKENEEFDLAEVITGITNKLITRHPHVFGNVIAAKGEGGALASWEAAKRIEKGATSYTKTLKDVPISMPALMRSYKVQQKAALAGFDWDLVDEAFAKVDEEILELKDAYKINNMESIIDELGDLIFSAVNVARFLGVQPELALTATTEKFIKRFSYIEKIAGEQGKTLDNMSLKEMDELWNEAKNKFIYKN